MHSHHDEHDNERSKVFSGHPTGPILTKLITLILLCPSMVHGSDETDPVRFHPATPTPEPAHQTPHDGATTAPNSFPASVDTASPVMEFARFEESPAPASEQARSLEARLDELGALHGPYATELLETLDILASLYQEQDAHEQALATLERSEHIIRISKGLEHPDQIPVAERIVTSLSATGRVMEVEERLQSLLRLQQRLHGRDSLETIDARLRLGEWYLDRFNQLSNAPLQGSGATGLNSSTARTQAALEALDTAQRQFIEGITLMTDAEAYRDPVLLELEQHLLETYYLQAYHLDTEPRRHQLGDTARRDTGDSVLHRIYLGGEHAHNRILAYLADNPDTTVTDYARHLADKGDWHMLFSRKSSAMETYEEAETLLREGNIPTEVANGILRPEVPFSVPATPFNPLKAETEGEYEGYVDVAFELDREGRARRIRTVGRSSGLDADVELRLIELVRASQFRPHIREGKAVGRDEVRMRYYYTH